jgi:predicted transcriptional regulator
MGITKSSNYTNRQNELADQLKAISHPARLAILEHLLKTRACINSELVSELNLAQATISQHLRELKEAQLIQGTIDGVSICYCINPNTWKELQAKLSSLFNEYKGPCEPNCC